jgi:hypothetical protein
MQINRKISKDYWVTTTVILLIQEATKSLRSCFRDATNNYDYHTTKVIKLITGRNGCIYYRKTNRHVWDKQKMQGAIDAVNKEVGWLKATTTFVLHKQKYVVARTSWFHNKCRKETGCYTCVL